MKGNQLFKRLFYFTLLGYLLAISLLTLMIWNRNASWSQYLRVEFDLGYFTLLKITVWTNIISTGIIILTWGVGQIHAWNLSTRYKKLQRELHEVKARLYDQHISESKPRETDPPPPSHTNGQDISHTSPDKDPLEQGDLSSEPSTENS